MRSGRNVNVSQLWTRERKSLYPYIKSWSESRLKLGSLNPTSQVQIVSLMGDVWVERTYECFAARLLFEDLRFLVGGQELLLILETDSGCPSALRSSSLYLSVWLVANLAFGDCLPAPCSAVLALLGVQIAWIQSKSFSRSSSSFE